MRERDIYQALKFFNDLKAVERAWNTHSLSPIFRRVGRRAYGKASGQLARRLFG